MKPFRAITRVGILALAGLIWMAFPAAAGPVVDPSTLQPPPPGAECRADGQSIICHTSLVLTPVNEPVAELPCGTVYETSNDVRRGIRWYNSDGKLVKRFVTQDLEGTWSLSPTGASPTAKLTTTTGATRTPCRATSPQARPSSTVTGSPFRRPALE